MSLVSIVLPYASYHADIVDRAIASAKAQTVKCEIITIHDNLGQGAGWARNRGLAQVKTSFVEFLDADDTIDPTFTEKTLTAYEPGHYVYTDWWVNQEYHHAIDPWILKPTDDPHIVKSDWHVITALLPTEAVKSVGGFDETLPSIEDTYFYWALTRSGICGICVPEALFHYGSEGRRAKNFINTPERQILMQQLVERYKDMGCCGEDGPVQGAPQNETLQDGFIWVQALWGGNQRRRGQMTGLLYPRTGNGKIAQVDKRDVQAQPHLWREVRQQPIIPTPPKPVMTAIQIEDTPQVAQDIPVTVMTKEAHGVEEVAAALYPKNKVIQPPESMEPVKVKPDVQTVKKLARRGRRAK